MTDDDPIPMRSVPPPADAPICQYCGRRAALIRMGDRNIWKCSPCCAWVGCHPGTTTPLGTLADGQLRDMRVLVHRNLDALWHYSDEPGARSRVYRWLARTFKLTEAEAHVGMFDPDVCLRVLSYFWTVKPTWADIKAQEKRYQKVLGRE